MMEAPAMAPAEFYVSDSGVSYDYSYEQTVANVATERMVIQNVDMSIVVTDPKARMEEIADMAVEMGGFVVSSNLYQSTYGPNNIEVPEASMTNIATFTGPAIYTEEGKFQKVEFADVDKGKARFLLHGDVVVDRGLAAGVAGHERHVVGAGCGIGVADLVTI